MDTSWLARGEAGLPAGDAWLSAAERERAAGMRFSKRRTEFLVARWTAKQALSLVHPGPGPAPERFEVRHHSTGAPEAYLDGAPLDIGISLTDRAGWAVCLLGHGRIGCDLELVEPRGEAFVRDYFTPAERRFIGHDDLRANLLWSAKESALKVLRTGLRRDTRSVEVSAADAPDPGRWAPLSVTAVEGAVFPGWWARYGAFLLTVASEREIPPPEALERPPALASAVPAHSWTGRLASDLR